MIVQTDFLGHWKTKLLVNKTGWEAAPLAVIRLWAHCQSSRRWEFPEMTGDQLAAVCDWGAHEPPCAKALLDAGFIHRMGRRGFRVHDWEVINSQLIASWKNGPRGGRPRVSQSQEGQNRNQAPENESFESASESTEGPKPTGYPPGTHVEPIRVDKSRVEETREEKTESLPLTTPHSSPEMEALRVRIGGWFNRRESTAWSEKELKALKTVLKLNTPEDDLVSLENRYLSGCKYLRRDILTLLNNWNGEIDRAKRDEPRPYSADSLRAPDERRLGNGVARHRTELADNARAALAGDATGLPPGEDDAGIMDVEMTPEFKALASVDGWSESTPLTIWAFSDTSKALSQILGTGELVEASEITRRIGNWSSHFNYTPTSKQIAKNWALLAVAGNRTNAGNAGNAGNGVPRHRTELADNTRAALSREESDPLPDL